MGYENNSNDGRPGDYIHPEVAFQMGLRQQEEEAAERRARIPIGGAIAFIFVLCVAPLIIVFSLEQHAKEQKSSFYTAPPAPERHASAPPMLRTLTGSIAAVSDERSTRHASSRGTRINFRMLIPRRFVTLNNYSTSFLIPRYVTLLLREETLRKAKQVSIQYYDEPQYQSVPQLDYDEKPGPYGYPMAKIVRANVMYYDVAGITVDGVTYLVPAVYAALENPVSWILIMLVLGWLFLAGLRRVFD